MAEVTERQVWRVKVDVPRDTSPEDWQWLGEQFVHSLRSFLAQGWVLEGQPVVSDDEDFMRNVIKVEASALVRRVTS